MSRLVDLDAARKARDEKKGKPPTLKLGGTTFTLPPALPAAVIVAMAESQKGGARAVTAIADAARTLFGDQLDAVLAAGLELEDFGTIVEQAYGDDAGE